MDHVDPTPVQPPPVLSVSPSYSDSVLLIPQVSVRPAFGHVCTDGKEVALSNAQLYPTTHRVSISERLDVVSIWSSPPTSLRPRTPPLGSAARAKMVYQLDLPES